MTSAMLQPPLPVPASAAPPSPTIKKRRRRAPATGAAEDCFTCRAAGIKCDRRRPYCGPCLQKHDGCEGYRTQLTWGVGVASRGKLRGLHLPVTNAQLEKRSENDKKSAKSSAAGKAAGRGKTPGGGGGGTYAGISRSSPQEQKLSIITNYDFVNMECPSSMSTASARTPASSTHPSPMQRIKQEPSPQTPLYAQNNQPRYLSPIPPPAQQQPATSQPQYTPSPQYSKSPYAVPQQLLSPMSEYEPVAYTSAPPAQYAAMSTSAPASAPLYDLVTGVSSAGGYSAYSPAQNQQQWQPQQQHPHQQQHHHHHQQPPQMHHSPQGHHHVHHQQPHAQPQQQPHPNHHGLSALLYEDHELQHIY